MQQLNRHFLAGRPEAALLSLPEKVIQFGTGVLLRGLPDFLIDTANRQGQFGGRVVAVKSTGAGDIAAFERQDNLYTLCIRGVRNGQPVAENRICSALSRVLSAGSQWQEILQCAANPLLDIVVSNTTEVGIQLLREDVRQAPPASFPGKLLAFLLARYHAFQGDPARGMVIIPTELVADNGDLLRSIVTELAQFNRLEPGFLEWLGQSCTFCNSLVDRIVPGQPGTGPKAEIEASLGYTDELLSLAEPYALWAIEGDERVARVLGFQAANPESVVVAPDIRPFRERKLRLLNGTHTLSCGLAHLAGFPTVHTAMEHPAMARFIERLMLTEIAPAIPFPLPPGEAEQFGRQVLDRFRNPSVEHRWLSITVQYSAKMRLRNIPVLLEHYRRQPEPPPHFALGFAAFLCFYRQPSQPVQDEQAPYFLEKWDQLSPETLVHELLSDTALWGADLSVLPGFEAQVRHFVLSILRQGPRGALMDFLEHPR